MAQNAPKCRSRHIEGEVCFVAGLVHFRGPIHEGEPKRKLEKKEGRLSDFSAGKLELLQTLIKPRLRVSQEDAAPTAGKDPNHKVWGPFLGLDGCTRIPALVFACFEGSYPTKPEVVMLGRGSYDNAPGESVV